MATAKGTRKRSVAKTSPSQRSKGRAAPPAAQLTVSDEELYNRIAQRAYQLYQERGEEHGHDLTDWLAAEQLVRAELLHSPAPEEPMDIE